MGMTIGRASVDRCVSNMSFDGDRLTITGRFEAASIAAAKVLRAQLLGLANNPDEPVVPVTSTLDPDLDGFYRVLGVSAAPTRRRGFRETGATAGRHDWTVSLERVAGGYSKPQFEVAYTITVRANDHGAVESTASTHVDTLPADILSDEYGEVVDIGGTGTVSGTEDGSLRTVSSPTNRDPFFARYWADAANFYKGSARIEIKIGSTWYPWIGRQLPSGVGRNWRISNGQIRVYLNTAITGRLVVERYSSSSWTASQWSFSRFYQAGGGPTAAYFGYPTPISNTLTTALDPVILRNSPEMVVVSLPQHQGQFETYALRRGAYHVDVDMCSGSDQDMGVRLASAASVTQIDEADMWTGGTGTNPAGFYTATNGEFHRGCVVVANTATLNTTDGEIYCVPYTTLPNGLYKHWFGIGVIDSTSLDITDFLSVVGIAQRVVAR